MNTCTLTSSPDDREAPYEKYTIMSDIHANLEALRAVMEQMRLPWDLNELERCDKAFSALLTFTPMWDGRSVPNHSMPNIHEAEQSEAEDYPWVCPRLWLRSDEDQDFPALSIGVGTYGATVHPDLYQFGDGTHGIIAGATGSGKSGVPLSNLVNSTHYLIDYENIFLSFRREKEGDSQAWLGQQGSASQIHREYHRMCLHCLAEACERGLLGYPMKGETQYLGDLALLYALETDLCGSAINRSGYSSWELANLWNIELGQVGKSTLISAWLDSMCASASLKEYHGYEDGAGAGWYLPRNKAVLLSLDGSRKAVRCGARSSVLTLSWVRGGGTPCRPWLGTTFPVSGYRSLAVARDTAHVSRQWECCAYKLGDAAPQAPRWYFARHVSQEEEVANQDLFTEKRQAQVDPLPRTPLLNVVTKGRAKREGGISGNVSSRSSSCSSSFGSSEDNQLHKTVNSHFNNRDKQALLMWWHLAGKPGVTPFDRNCALRLSRGDNDEESSSSNRTKFGYYFGWNYQPWCADFVSTMFDSTDNRDSLPNEPTPLSWLQDVVVNGESTSEHQVILEKYDVEIFEHDPTLTTVDGYVLISHTRAILRLRETLTQEERACGKQALLRIVREQPKLGVFFWHINEPEAGP